MKQLTFLKSALITVIAAWLLASSTALSQIPGTGAPAGVNAMLTRLFDNVAAFSAKADVRVLDKAQQESMSVTMDFAFSENKIRVEIDMAQMKAKNLPAGAADSLKQMGMNRVVSVIRPDKKATHIIYPGLQSYVTMPLSKEEVEALEKKPKAEKTALGKETLDGHPCVKNKVVITDDKGGKLESTIWEATDLKDFPVQISTKERDDTVMLRFKQVQFAKPDAKQFDVPAGFIEYGDIAQLMQGVMKKMMGGQSAK